jgi:hypothetical protein
LLQQQIVKAGFLDLINAVWRAKVFAKRRALPGNGAGFGHNRQLKRGEIANAHKLGARLNGLGNFRIRQRGQKPREPITAARDHGHIGAAGGCSANGCQPGDIVARKAQMAAQRIRIHLHLVPQRAQVLKPAFESRLVVHRARRQKNVNVAHEN